jgi:hypothetical protein
MIILHFVFARVFTRPLWFRIFYEKKRCAFRVKFVFKTKLVLIEFFPFKTRLLLFSLVSCFIQHFFKLKFGLMFLNLMFLDLIFFDLIFFDLTFFDLIFLKIILINVILTNIVVFLFIYSAVLLSLHYI